MNLCHHSEGTTCSPDSLACETSTSDPSDAARDLAPFDQTIVDAKLGFPTATLTYTSQEATLVFNISCDRSAEQPRVTFVSETTATTSGAPTEIKFDVKTSSPLVCLRHSGGESDAAREACMLQVDDGVYDLWQTQ